MENASVVNAEISLTQEVVKNFAISASTAAGMMVGFVAIGFVKNKIDERKARKADPVLSPTE